jgi:transposase InsO family protein
VKSLLQLADIPRSTYYYWVKNFGRPDPDAELKKLIQAIYDEHEGRYGYRRIRDVSTMLDRAFERLTDEDKLLIHSDQGWHYQMKQHRHALCKRGIKYL